MTSTPSTPTTTTLTANLQRLGLTHTADSVNDLVARATQKRWSPVVLLETLTQAELDERARRRLERQLRDARLGRFKALADFEWDWPKQIHRPTIDRVFTLDFLTKSENIVLVGNQGLGKTMLSKNLVHHAVLAGHSALFVTASDLLLDLNSQDTSRALERRLRAYARPHLLAIDEIGYLAYDTHAADLLFQIISRRYEQRSIVVTTNLVFKEWNTVFPNASCAVALIDRLTHHAEIIRIEGDSYRHREAELTQKKRRASP
jgi:DNA replication protein DnaC